MRVRRVSGGREGELLHRAAELRKSVDPLLPRLAGDAPRDRFDRLRAELDEVREARDDAARLTRLGRGWKDPLARALAGLYAFYLDPGQPVVANASFPGGEVSFAVLNAAPREAHIAVQEGDDPAKLLLGYLGRARKGFHFFADADGLVCTGRDATPPARFVERQVGELPYRLQATPGGRAYACPHLRAGAHRPFLEIRWIGPDAAIQVCEGCVRDDRQLLAALSSGVAGPDPERTFAVDVHLNVDCPLGAGCVHGRLPELPRGIRKRYVFGRLSDLEVVREYRALARDRIERAPGALFVAAGRCFGGDRAAFLAALGPTADERRALEEILPTVEGPFEIDELTASRALERLWPTHAEEIVRAIVPDPDRAARLVREARANPGRVSDLLRRAGRETREREVLDSLPRYAGLSPEAAFVDSVARTYRSQGAGEAVKRLLADLPREGKERGLAFGLLEALSAAPAHRWQFTDTEQRFGGALADAARRLLEAPAEAYDRALGELMGGAGVAHWGHRVADAA
ncbi:MAG TPA: hypothetical protein VMH78_06535 [Thermoplasmata archaeon]|nr:hypothetical protein [Thermoplasmata archaeon]